ncbi:hypothetical protein FB645_002057 [Coemansia sp. IMI 203386]|nr:hypothetical protein FB645_002057 [Coemansia sp. IMI 203386]
MKFGSTLLFASLFSALTYAQPAANVEALARRNYAAVNNNNVVVVTVTKTVYVKANQAVAQPTPTISSSLQPVPHAAQTTYVAPTTTTPSSSSSSVVAATPVETTPAASSDDWRSEMLSRLNEVRAAAGKSAVTLDSNLNTIAQSHSQYQSSVNQMTHSDPSGSLGTRLNARSISWMGSAENIAWNQRNVASVMAAWTKSSGHYANMIGDYTRVGFGESNLYWTQDFIKA